MGWILVTNTTYERIVTHRRFKILPLSFPFTQERDLWIECVQVKNKIAPHFYRDGYYFDRQTKRAWLEIDGEAWLYGSGNPDGFKRELYMQDGNNAVEDRVYNAIGLLISSRIIKYSTSKEIYELYYLESAKRQCRSVYVNSRIECRKILARINNMKDDNYES
jgi:hypothetical protein